MHCCAVARIGGVGHRHRLRDRRTAADLDVTTHAESWRRGTWKIHGSIPREIKTTTSNAELAARESHSASSAGSALIVVSRRRNHEGDRRPRIRQARRDEARGDAPDPGRATCSCAPPPVHSYIPAPTRAAVAACPASMAPAKSSASARRIRVRAR
jgi:hypothetical protein